MNIALTDYEIDYEYLSHLLHSIELGVNFLASVYREVDMAYEEAHEKLHGQPKAAA